jgi:hypothetical protein
MTSTEEMFFSVGKLELCRDIRNRPIAVLRCDDENKTVFVLMKEPQRGWVLQATWDESQIVKMCVPGQEEQVDIDINDVVTALTAFVTDPMMN